MFSFWPKSVPIQFIEPLRRLGGRNLRLENFKRMIGRPLGGRKALQADVRWDGNLTLAEHHVTKMVLPPAIMSLAPVLANGVKLFRMPDSLEVLEEIEIPIAVKDMALPFPAVVVERANGEVHFVGRHGPMVLASTFLPGGMDYIAMFDPEQAVEHFMVSLPEDFKGVQPIIEDFKRHRFRATLNFLLLCCCEGIFSEGHLAKPKKVRKNPAYKAANPEVFRLQSIKLFHPRTISALESAASTGKGSSKRPHHRRAHWRHVATGVGRGNRELRLIPATFINKDKLLSREPAEVEYVASI